MDIDERMFKMELKKKIMDRVDCTFYFILNKKDVYITLKEEYRNRICRWCAETAGVRNYIVRYGSDIRSGLKLKEEFRQKSEEQVDIIYVNFEESEATLLNPWQRMLFFNTVRQLEEDVDTLEIVQQILEDSERNDCDLEAYKHIPESVVERMGDEQHAEGNICYGGYSYRENIFHRDTLC